MKMTYNVDILYAVETRGLNKLKLVNLREKNSHLDQDSNPLQLCALPLSDASGNPLVRRV